MDTSSLSHPRAVTAIKDPIHDTIVLTCFEREIVDSDHFQRLHFVLQNSTSYVAFPSNKNSRFSHSLGVCHLSGLLFANALRNSSPEDLEAFLETSAMLVHEVAVKAQAGAAAQLRNAWKNTISGHSGFRHRPSLRTVASNTPLRSLNLDTRFPKANETISDDRRFTGGMLVDTLWQAIRICGLVHDIGHLPMSHSLEGAAEKLKVKLNEIFPATDKDIDLEEHLAGIYAKITCTETYLNIVDEFDRILGLAYPEDEGLKKVREAFASFPLHERRSLYILNVLFQENLYSFDGDKASYRSLIYNLAFLILFSSIESERKFGEPKNGTESAFLNNSAFRFLKLIIAGAVDGDRMDYTIRDGHACGSQIGQYDVAGIVENATLFREKYSGDFRVGYFYRALPAIEQFFAQRHQGYKYLIYHRTSSRTEACLQNLILEILEFCYLDPNDEISKYFMALGYFCEQSDGFHRIFPVYLEAELDNHGNSALSTRQVPFLDDANLRSYLEWVLQQIEQRPLQKAGIKAVKLDRIALLSSIVLKRQFQHIYDPFKDSSLRISARRALKRAGESAGLSQSKIDTITPIIQNLIARNAAARREMLDVISRCVSNELPGEVLFFFDIQKPKIYDHEISAQKGEELFLLYNGVDESGYVPVRPIVFASSTLNSMPNIFVDEFRINFYFVAKCIKKNKELKDLINRIMDESLEKAASTALRHLADDKEDVDV